MWVVFLLAHLEESQLVVLDLECMSRDNLDMLLDSPVELVSHNMV